MLRMECTDCKKKKQLPLKRTKHFELGGEKKRKVCVLYHPKLQYEPVFLTQSSGSSYPILNPNSANFMFGLVLCFFIQPMFLNNRFMCCYVRPRSRVSCMYHVININDFTRSGWRTAKYSGMLFCFGNSV